MAQHQITMDRLLAWALTASALWAWTRVGRRAEGGEQDAQEQPLQGGAGGFPFGRNRVVLVSDPGRCPHCARYEPQFQAEMADAIEEGTASVRGDMPREWMAISGGRIPFVAMISPRGEVRPAPSREDFDALRDFLRQG